MCAGRDGRRCGAGLGAPLGGGGAGTAHPGRAAPAHGAVAGARADAEQDVRLHAGPFVPAAPCSSRCELRARGGTGAGLGAACGGAGASHRAVSRGGALEAVGVPGLCAHHQPLGRVRDGAHRGVRRHGPARACGHAGCGGRRGGALQLRRPGGGQCRQGVGGRHRCGGGRLASGAHECAGPRGAGLHPHPGRVSDRHARPGSAHCDGASGGHLQPGAQHRSGEPAAARQPWSGGCVGAHRGHRRQGRVAGRGGGALGAGGGGAHAQCQAVGVRRGGADGCAGDGVGEVAAGGELGAGD